eukprot:CAMPEP_0181327934 /NCGR_PEP_ID=MMETSP1101-20121128/22400_1 /TAXON_ID=46948 /ORGANISM="Rhodomonas abbreviata, Strain Caron Lab Isolate" /LENGTH=99 /DNA_ID=CAMNT_0023436695 /DNA_START=45 /DNA_END=340 /DNA_ORIENTATION=+
MPTSTTSAPSATGHTTLCAAGNTTQELPLQSKTSTRNLSPACTVTFPTKATSFITGQQYMVPFVPQMCLQLRNDPSEERSRYQGVGVMSATSGVQLLPA